jgi:hypothetical protein
MSYKTEIQFIEERAYTNGYSEYKKYKNMKYDDFFRELRRSAISGKDISRFYLTTRIKERFLRSDLYLAVLDCDCDITAETATRCLDRHFPMAYYRVQNLLDHSWIFCDKIGTVKEIVEFMKDIPGVGQDYISLCSRNKCINLRAYPKRIASPVFDSFITVDHSRNGKRPSQEYITFLYNLREYWTGSDMQEILTRLNEGDAHTRANSLAQMSLPYNVFAMGTIGTASPGLFNFAQAHVVGPAEQQRQALWQVTQQTQETQQVQVTQEAKTEDKPEESIPKKSVGALDNLEVE